MTQPTQDLRFLTVNADGTRNSLFPLGDKPVAGLVHITGADLGVAPPIIIYTDWSQAPLGEMSLTNDGIGSDWTQVEQRPKVFNAWGKNGISLREGGTDYLVDNRPTSVGSQWSPKRNYSVAYEKTVPAGRHFPAASTTNSLPVPLSSALKSVWLFDGPPDSPTKADVVVGTWVSDSFNLLGNQCPYNLYGGANFDFSGWNHFKGKSIAGADPFVDAGYSAFQTTNAIGGNDLVLNTTSPSFGAGATAAQYDRMEVPAWSGQNNGNSLNLAQLIYSYIYVAVSDDNSVNAEVELRNHATWASATKLRLIPPTSWNPTEIFVNIPAHIMAMGFTHYRVTTATGQIFDGAIV